MAFVGTSSTSSTVVSTMIQASNSPTQIISYKEPFYRVDTVGIKSKLTDLLGYQASDYWATLTTFLLGKLKRDEFEGLISGFLNTSVKRHLHNALLTALLHNASSTLPISVTPTLSTDPAVQARTDLSISVQSSQAAKRARESSDDDDLDFIPPKLRVRRWVLGMTKTQRERIKSHVGDQDEDDNVVELNEMVKGWQGRLRVSTFAKRKHNKAMASETTRPYCQSIRGLPLDEQLQARIELMAREYGLLEGADEEIGQFLTTALKSHLDTLLRSTWELMKSSDPATPTASESQSSPPRRSSVSASDGTDPTDVSEVLYDHDSVQHPEPRGGIVDLAQLEALFGVSPYLHPQAGSSVFKLRSGLLRFQQEQGRLAEDLRQAREARWDEEAGNLYIDLPFKPESQMIDSGVFVVPSATTDKSAAHLIPRGARSLLRPGPGGIIPRVIKKKEAAVESASHAETMVEELATRGLLKISDRGPLQVPVAGSGGKGDGEVKDHHDSHWSYVDPAVIFKDILG